jgi:hypothetical protein
VIHVKDLVLPANVKLITDPELPVITCEIPREEVLPTAADAAAAEATEPEVLKQKKPEEIAAEDAAKAEAKAKEEKKDKK